MPTLDRSTGIYVFFQQLPRAVYAFEIRPFIAEPRRVGNAVVQPDPEVRILGHELAGLVCEQRGGPGHCGEPVIIHVGPAGRSHLDQMEREIHVGLYVYLISRCDGMLSKAADKALKFIYNVSEQNLSEMLLMHSSPLRINNRVKVSGCSSALSA